MKKAIFLFSVVALFFISCSSSDDDSSNNQSDFILLKKETRSTLPINESGVETINYIYDGNKIKKITTDTQSYYTEFTYSGELITKIEVKSYEGELLESNFYEYNANNQLILSRYVGPSNSDFGYKRTFVYNTDGTVSYDEYIGDSISQTEFSATVTLSFLNNDVSQYSRTSGNSTTISNFIYDNKNNFYKNILGFDKIFGGSITTGIFHNVVSEINATAAGGTVTNSYTYNSQGYPITKTSDNTSLTVQYFYE
jgi:hypothetical protein